MTEAELQTALVRHARSQGWLEHRAWTSLHSPKGWPDQTFARGLFLCVWELKNPKGVATIEQIAWLDWWATFGAGVASLATIADVRSAARPPRIHVALVRPADLEAAYWLLMGQPEREGHPWPAEWNPNDPNRGKP
jgi:hypothetical protein